MYSFFNDLKDKELGERLSLDGMGGVNIECNEPEGHKYVFGFTEKINECTLALLGDGYFVEADRGINVCLFFYDENRKLLSKNILKNNQVSLLEMPSCFQSIDFYFRVTGTKTKAVDAIVALRI